MINKIVAVSLLFFAMIALWLALFGVKEVELSKPFMSFLQNTSRELNDYKIAIPNIPNIPKIEYASSGEWYEVLINAVNGIIVFLNGLVGLLNFIVIALNTIIQLVQFIILLIKNLITMRNQILPS